MRKYYEGKSDLFEIRFGVIHYQELGAVWADIARGEMRTGTLSEAIESQNISAHFYATARYLLALQD